MQNGDDQQRLLSEIRDILREHLDEYRRVTEEHRRVTAQSLEQQRRAILYQEQIGRIYKFALAGVGLIVVAGVAVICYFIRLP